MDEALNADPQTTAYSTGSFAAHTAPYVAYGAAGSGNVAPALNNALGGFLAKGAAPSLVRYIGTNMVEGAALDATTAAVVGDNPAMAALGGGLGGGIGSFFKVNDVRRAIIEGQLSQAAGSAGKALGKEAATGNLSTDPYRYRMARVTLGANYDAFKDTVLTTAVKQGKTGLISLEKTLKQGRPGFDAFIDVNQKNAVALARGGRQFADSFTPVPADDLGTAVAQEFQAGIDTALAHYDEGKMAGIAEVLNLGEGGLAVLDKVKISPAGVGSFAGAGALGRLFSGLVPRE